MGYANASSGEAGNARGPLGSKGSDRLICPLSIHGDQRPSPSASRIDFSTDILVESTRLVNDLDERSQFETLLVDFTASLVELPIDQIDAQITSCLRKLATFLDVDRCSFSGFHDGEREPFISLCYVAESTSPLAESSVGEVLPWFTARIRRGEVLRFDRMPDDIPMEAVDERAYAVANGLKSVLAIPLRANRSSLYVLTIATRREYREWPPGLVQRLWLIGQIFANSIARKQAEVKARQLNEQLARIGRVTLVGELAAVIAHEIKQPLCAIVSNAQAGQRMLSADQPGLIELRATLMDIASDSHRANEVVKRVRSMLQKQAVESIPLCLNDSIREVLEVIHGQLIKNRISVSLDLLPDLPRVVGDRIQLQQVVLNLAMNAIEAMQHADHEPRELVIQTCRHENGTVLVKVRDSGSGISPEHRELVFDSFFTTKPTGIGVGLAICRFIVEAHEGKLWVEPDSGKGAEFNFILPIAREAEHDR